jgi:hypothetical protein
VDVRRQWEPTGTVGSLPSLRLFLSIPTTAMHARLRRVGNDAPMTGTDHGQPVIARPAVSRSSWCRVSRIITASTVVAVAADGLSRAGPTSEASEARQARPGPGIEAVTQT